MKPRNKMTLEEKQKDNRRRDRQRKLKRELDRLASVGRLTKRCGSENPMIVVKDDDLLKDLENLKGGEQE